MISRAYYKEYLRSQTNSLSAELLELHAHNDCERCNAAAIRALETRINEVRGQLEVLESRGKRKRRG